MVGINYFKQFYEYLAEKNQIGNTMTPTQFNLNCNQVQLQIYSEDYQTFFKTKVVTNFLQSFLKLGDPQPVPTTDGIIAYPADLQYVSSVSHYYNGLKYDCEYVDSVDWDKIQMPNSLEIPTRRFAKYRQITNGIQLAPTTLGIAYVNYFKTPVPPVWNYTIVNNEAVYDPTDSVDFEWDNFSTNRAMSILLSYVGINLKDMDVAGFAKEFEAQTQVIA